MTNRSDENDVAAAAYATTKHQSEFFKDPIKVCLLYTSPSPRDRG